MVGPAISLSVALGLGRGSANLKLQIPLVASATALAVALIMLGVIYWPRSFYRPPDPLPFSQEYLGRPLIDTKLMMLATMAAAYNLNRGRLQKNWRVFKIAFSFFVVAAILGLVALALGATT